MEHLELLSTPPKFHLNLCKFEGEIDVVEPAEMLKSQQLQVEKILNGHGSCFVVPEVKEAILS